jgi:hypothetical protein
MKRHNAMIEQMRVEQMKVVTVEARKMREVQFSDLN